MYFLWFILYALFLKLRPYKFIHCSVAPDSEPDAPIIQSTRLPSRFFGHGFLARTSWEKVEQHKKIPNLNHIKGVYTPQNCNLPGPGYKVAIIIPFRDITKDPWTNRPVFWQPAYSLFSSIVLKLSTDPWKDQYRTERLKWLLHYMIPILIRSIFKSAFWLVLQ